MASTGPVRRKPGDRNDFDARPDPNAQYLGEQSLDGGGSALGWLSRLVGALLAGRGRRRGR